MRSRLCASTAAAVLLLTSSLTTAGNAADLSVAPIYKAPPRLAAWTGAYLGVAYNPYPAGGDPNDPGYKAPNLELPGELNTSRVGDRQSLTNSNPASGDLKLDGYVRKPDEWQPAWIVEKYF